MLEDSKISSAENAAEFDKNLQGLRDFSAQLYHAADYWEKTFLKTEDKRIVVETTKEYISKAVVTVVDHLGSISSKLESCFSKSNSIPETEHKIDFLKLKFVTWQQQSHKLALARFYWTNDFSRHHCRYILPRTLYDPGTPNVVSRDTKRGKRVHFETEEPLFLLTHSCKPSLVANPTRNVEKNDVLLHPVVPVCDALSILPKAEQSTFQFQEARRLKHSMVNWKLMQNKDISSLVRRGKRILAEI